MNILLKVKPKIIHIAQIDAIIFVAIINVFVQFISKLFLLTIFYHSKINKITVSIIVLIVESLQS